MRLYIARAPKQAAYGAALDSPATIEDRELVFRLLGSTWDVADFFRDEPTVGQFLALLRAHGLENGPETAIQNLYGEFRSCFQNSESRETLPANRKLKALLEEAMDRAVERKDGASIAALCAAGVNINEKDKNGYKFLVKALKIIPVDLDRVQLLCVNGAKLIESEWAHRLVWVGQIKALAILLEHGAISRRDRDRLLFGALDAPAEVRVYALRVLLDNGASPNHIDEDGGVLSLLTAAALHGRKDCVRFLLSRGADPDGLPGFTCPIDQAIMRKDVEMTGALARAGASLSNLSSEELEFAEKARGHIGMAI
jgi:hypothetical protein